MRVFFFLPFFPPVSIYFDNNQPRLLQHQLPTLTPNNQDNEMESSEKNTHIRIEIIPGKLYE